MFTWKLYIVHVELLQNFNKHYDVRLLCIAFIAVSLAIFIYLVKFKERILKFVLHYVFQPVRACLLVRMKTKLEFLILLMKKLQGQLWFPGKMGRYSLPSILLFIIIYCLRCRLLLFHCFLTLHNLYVFFPGCLLHHLF